MREVSRRKRGRRDRLQRAPAHNHARFRAGGLENRPHGPLCNPRSSAASGVGRPEVRGGESFFKCRRQRADFRKVAGGLHDRSALDRDRTPFGPTIRKKNSFLMRPKPECY